MTDTPLKKRGARKRLPVQTPFNTTLTAEHRAKLEGYADSHHISLAEALRQAIDALPSVDGGARNKGEREGK